MKPLAFEDSPGFLYRKAELEVELRFLRQLERHGFIAILNDLTNDLRYGDVTVVRDDGYYVMVEMKTSVHSNTKWTGSAINLIVWQHTLIREKRRTSSQIPAHS